jgi:branched-chain amino acid transport system permease protein
MPEERAASSVLPRPVSVARPRRATRAGWVSLARKYDLAFAVPLVVLVALAPVLVENELFLDALVLLLLWAGMSSAWNILGGYAGAFSLGHAAFFGIGAYASTILFVRFGVSPWLGMLVGALISALCGVVLGLITIRLRGPFFAVASIAFAEVLFIVAREARGLTRGSEGISIPFRPGFGNMVFRGYAEFIWIVGAYALLMFLLQKWLDNKRPGYWLVALRENADAAEALGVDTVRVRVIAAGVSAFLTAVGGTLYAQYIAFIDPFFAFSVDNSIRLALITIIGGLGTALGPFLGSALVTGLELLLRAQLGAAESGLYLVVYGTILILLVLLLPHGIVPLLRRRPAWPRRGAHL